MAPYTDTTRKNVTHGQLIDLSARFNSEIALDIAEKSSNALVVAEPDHDSKAQENIVDMDNIFLTKGMLNKQLHMQWKHLVIRMITNRACKLLTVLMTHVRRNTRDIGIPF